MTYTPPLDDMRFTLEYVVGLSRLTPHPDFGVLDGETVSAILEPAAQLASEILAPLNWTGDQQAATLSDGAVTTASGWKQAYTAYREGGWNAVPFSPAHGGQGLPWLVAFAVQEMWQGANMSFGLCPLLNQGAIEAIEAHGSTEQKEAYLPHLISGQWTGTMNLTEPQAGSDLAAIRTKAVRETDGTYRISGQKIYITYGEHDLSDNIIHLVLARTPNAPEGVKGISLFIVPKILSDGTRNDVICTGIEHKLGIHASPTCTMQFGDRGGAVGYLIGQENEGLKYMFTMMNNARLSVGLQGVAIAEAALQKSAVYARDRVQGFSLSDKTKRVPIAEHADVKRMLRHMKSLVCAGRALTYEAALHLDLARAGDTEAQMKVDFLTPIVKAWCTDNAVEVASMGVQIHGGMGFIEETGAAQFYRDARILPIYEGTNGIQAMDLVFRKIARDQGATALSFLTDSEKFSALAPTAHKLKVATQWIAHKAVNDPEAAAFASVPYLKAMGILAGGYMLSRMAHAAKGQMTSEDNGFFSDYITLSDYYRAYILPTARAYLEPMV
ncbi:MAG: acyl-CoA dehydrogenase [Alphaproteobacteria bacterium]|nr:acyl-CoA dehydrogenase [Alphaproteobacteria bacterium]